MNNNVTARDIADAVQEFKAGVITAEELELLLRRADIATVAEVADRFGL